MFEPLNSTATARQAGASALARSRPNAAEKVVLLAEQRIGAELKVAQERGEVESRGGDRRSINVPDGNNDRPAALPDLAISRKRAAEAKALAELGEDAARLFEAEARKRQEAGRQAGGHARHGSLGAEMRATTEHRKSADDAARLLNVSPRHPDPSRPLRRYLP
jgi:hypothetical protein